MPDYKPPIHGVTLSEALHEAAAIAPITRAMLYTYELYHPLGTPEGPVYVVNNPVVFFATKEGGAIRDAGLEVEYLASAIGVTRPEESEAKSAPEIALTVANVSGLMSDALRRARGSLVPWELVERLYASDDPSGPAINPPTTVYLTAVDVDGETVTLRASGDDSGAVSVPRLTFRRPEYPVLVR